MCISEERVEKDSFNKESIIMNEEKRGMKYVIGLFEHLCKKSEKSVEYKVYKKQQQCRGTHCPMPLHAIPFDLPHVYITCDKVNTHNPSLPPLFTHPNTDARHTFDLIKPLLSEKKYFFQLTCFDASLHVLKIVKLKKKCHLCFWM